MARRHYPKHLAGRVYGVVAHGGVAGVEGVRRVLCDWLGWMGLFDAGPKAQLDRYIGYYGHYATSHRTLDEDRGVQREAENAGAAVAGAVKLRREGKLPAVGSDLEPPRPK